ncbi:hypothetical protein [Pseudorhodobacter ferrugineus]|uniref:hypothetical protein n=1 Tax=Pseudorhodobacter ferrugineus TaxID=77008 RepID=UPI0003B7B1FC|nr:hypothetical protein [Pseudorhodobacter ferrugineus]
MRGAILIALLPSAAFACALPPSIIMTLPTGYYMLGAAVTVAVTGLLATTPRLVPDMTLRTLLTRRVWLPVSVTSYAAWIVLLALVLIGFVGARDPMHNLLTLIIWTIVWVALPMGCMVFGNMWRAVNPWTAPIQLTRQILGRTRGAGIARLGHLPAVAGLFGFFWFYIVSMSPDDPQTLALATASYWTVIFVLGVVEGEDWLEQGEFLTVYFGYLSKIAPFWLEVEGPRATLHMGWPGTQVLAMPPLSPSAIGFVTLALAGLTFDGLRETFWYMAVIGENPLEFTGRSAVIGVNSFGLLLTWALTAATILAALRLGPMLQTQAVGAFAGGAGTTAVRANLMPVMLSFLAISAGYHAAHYLTTLLTAGQYTLAALNDPLFRGDDFLGLPAFYVSMGFLTDRWTMTLIWNTQFLLILGAHVLAVILALRLTPEGVQARVHFPLTALMVGYTVLGLWLLASPTG